MCHISFTHRNVAHCRLGLLLLSHHQVQYLLKRRPPVETPRMSSGGGGGGGGVRALVRPHPSLGASSHHTPTFSTVSFNMVQWILPLRNLCFTLTWVGATFCTLESFKEIKIFLMPFSRYQAISLITHTTSMMSPTLTSTGMVCCCVAVVGCADLVVGGADSSCTTAGPHSVPWRSEACLWSRGAI